MDHLLSILLGAGVGAAIAFAASYYSFLRKAYPQPREMSRTVKVPSSSSSSYAIPKPELEKSKRDARTLLIEKDVLSGALTRLYEAEVEGKISREERETLASRYRDQLRHVDEKLSNVEILIEVGELEILREELVNLFQEKISAIESRLEQTKLRLDKVKAFALPQTSKTVSISPTMEERTSLKVQQRQDREKEREKEKKEPEMDKRVKALRDEIFEALARLEQIDIER